MAVLYRFAFLTLFSLIGLGLSAQAFHFSVGMNLGWSTLNHQTRFETTELRNLYETIALTHADGYEWEQFEEDFELRQSFDQMRFGFFLKASHRKYPLLLIFEGMSSSSSYERMAYGVTAGFGQEFYLINQQIYCSFLGGYKLVWDKGFGANTLVNSIGHKDARNLVSSYFAPEKPLGPIKGNLFVLRGTLGKTVDKDRQWTFGVEPYYELDLTPRIKRESRMTNFGFNAFLRYSLFKERRYAAFNNNPNFY